MPIWQLQAPTAILFQLGAFSIRWYGVCLTLGIMIAYWAVARLRRHDGESMQVIEQLFLPVVLSGIIGGRLLHVILEWNYYSQYLWQIPQIWLGGLAIHGAIITGAIALYFFARRHHVNFFALLDQIVPGVALAQAIGRWGNYFNQELYGRPTTSWFGIYIEPAFRITNYESFSLFHPIFLYESVGLLLLGLILLGIARRKPASLQTSQGGEKGVRSKGIQTAVYLVGYGVIRFLVDILRIDPQVGFGGLRFGQWLSLVFIATGIILLGYKKKTKIKAIPTP